MLPASPAVNVRILFSVPWTLVQGRKKQKWSKCSRSSMYEVLLSRGFTVYMEKEGLCTSGYNSTCPVLCRWYLAGQVAPQAHIDWAYLWVKWEVFDVYDTGRWEKVGRCSGYHPIIVYRDCVTRISRHERQDLIFCTLNTVQDKKGKINRWFIYRGLFIQRKCWLKVSFCL